MPAAVATMPIQNKPRGNRVVSASPEQMVRELLGEFFHRCSQTPSCLCSILRNRDARMQRQRLPRVLVLPSGSERGGKRVALIAGVAVRELETVPTVVSITEYFIAMPERLSGTLLSIYPLAWGGIHVKQPALSLFRAEVEGNHFDLTVAVRLHTERESEVVVRGTDEAGDILSRIESGTGWGPRSHQVTTRREAISTPQGLELFAERAGAHLEIFLPRGWPTELQAAIFRHHFLTTILNIPR